MIKDIVKRVKDLIEYEESQENKDGAELLNMILDIIYEETDKDYDNVQHKGLNTHRFGDNPIEEIFAKLWEEENVKQLGKPNGLLEYLISSRVNEAEPVTAREAQVAATIIQWLGSPVGQSFLQIAEEKKKLKEASQKGKKMLKYT